MLPPFCPLIESCAAKHSQEVEGLDEAPSWCCLVHLHQVVATSGHISVLAMLGGGGGVITNM